MVVIGLFVRVDRECAPDVEERLAQLDGATLFPLETPGAVGLLLRAADPDDGYRRLNDELLAVPGVLAAWPLHTELAADPASEPAGAPTATSHR